MEQHRSGPLKQKNKQHKAPKKRLRKNSLNSSIRSSKSSSSSKNEFLKKIVRKNQQQQLRRLKREEILNQKRKISSAPILISILNYSNNDTDNNELANHFTDLLKTFEKQQTNFDGKNLVKISKSKHGESIHLNVLKFHTRYQFCLLNSNDLNSSIDLAKISDFLLVIHSAQDQCVAQNIEDEDNFQDETESSTSSSSSKNNIIFDAIYHHCMPASMHCIYGLDQFPSSKQKQQIKRSLFENLKQQYPGIFKSSNSINSIKTLDFVEDLKQLLFNLSTINRLNKFNTFQSYRCQLLAENFHFEPNPMDPTKGSLQLEGFIRNQPMDPNSLYYIPEFGEFQMEWIERLPNPYDNDHDQKRFNQQESFRFKIQSDPLERAELIRENPIQKIFDEEMLEREQEMNDFEQQSTSSSAQVSSKKKKVPKGTSDYQACWIVESDQEDDNGTDDDDHDHNKDVDAKIKQQQQQDVDKMDDPFDFLIQKIDNVDLSPKDDDDQQDDHGEDDSVDDIDLEDNKPEEKDYDDENEINMKEEQENLIKFKQQRLYEMFPDEIDTPQDKPARERFQKYRGLKSFRTTKWDPNENLPEDYSRIFQLKDFNRTRKRILKNRSKLDSSEPTSPMEPGFYIRCQLINVPTNLNDYFRKNLSKPIILNELLPYEQKMSVMNIILKKLPNINQLPIESKDLLIFHIGYRRFEAKPIFSAHTTGDKHKYEKYLRSDQTCVATIYGPITYPPASVLVFKKFENKDSNGVCHSHQELVAIGALKDCRPDRLIIKRLVLSGHPFKINRRHAVIRYMFFNREDILWFRPIELRTKYGRYGNILEPLGMHGHMKCRFNKQLSSQDTVLMYLYKRVFPKWYYKPLDFNDNVPTTTTADANADAIDVDESNINSVPLTSTTMES